MKKLTDMSENSEKAALQWYIDNGVTDVLDIKPVDKSVAQGAAQALEAPLSPEKVKSNDGVKKAQPVPIHHAREGADVILGTQEARVAAEKLAKEAQTLEALKQAIQDFDGLSVKKTALNIVFSDGRPDAAIMVIGEAPGADEDRQGKPFVGASGQLLDKIFGYIGLKRFHEDPNQGLYISNILNWRPPGNRTPTPAEMSIALPFIEKHIQLVRPKLLILVGNTPMKSLLNTKEGIMKMRGRWHDYTPVTEGIAEEGLDPIPTLPTFHPAFLLRNPMHKKTIWHDMIAISKKAEALAAS